MVDETARLSIGIDSGPVAKANAELDKFEASSKRAAAAADQFEASGKKAAAAANAIVSPGKAMAAAFASSTGAVKAQDAVWTNFTNGLVQANNRQKEARLLQESMAGAFARTTAVSVSASREVGFLGRAFGLTGQQAQILGFQVNDVISGLISGQGAFQIAAQQGGQIYQVFQSAEGGVRGVGRALLSMVTPTVLLGTAWTILGAAVGGAVISFNSSQSAAKLALTGIGAASGATINDINNVAIAAARSANLSTGAAREFATALVATGKIGRENLLPIVKFGTDFAKAFKVDAAEAMDLVAKAFADPVAGADKLNTKFGSLDDKSREYIRTLVELGDRTKAQQVILDTFAGAAERAAQKAGFFGRTWNAIKTGFDQTGQAIAEGFGGGTTEQRLDVSIGVQI